MKKWKHEELLQKMASQLDTVYVSVRSQGEAINGLCDRFQALENLVQQQGRQIGRTKLTATAAKLKADLHDEQIAKLKDEVDRLKQTAAIWWGDGRVALDRDESYKGFRRIHIEPRRALKELDALGILILDRDGKRTVPVRPDGHKKTRRAVMVKEGL